LERLETLAEIPLLYSGLPISLKSQISVEGLESNIGYVAWSGKLAEKNSVMTDMLLQQGGERWRG
jgi:Asp-tRNA(Asn)/Glu-tRNA(Gln) amidotransferase A subunit family amidase